MRASRLLLPAGYVQRYLKVSMGRPRVLLCVSEEPSQYTRSTQK